MERKKEKKRWNGEMVKKKKLLSVEEERWERKERAPRKKTKPVV